MGGDMTIDTATLFPILGGAVGAITGVAAIITAISSRKKTKADATKIIQEAAAAQVCRMELEIEKWQRECFELRETLEAVKVKVEENDICQTDLQYKVEALQRENEQLRRRVDELESENRRLRGC
jgi:predicted nuclease with TOPRIM domain